MSEIYERIYAVVRHIPVGRVATYGQVARLAGLGRRARQVGYALHALPPRSGVPWHRVLNAQGKVSLPDDRGENQRRRLGREGIKFDERQVIDFEAFGWRPRKRKLTRA